MYLDEGSEFKAALGGLTLGLSGLLSPSLFRAARRAQAKYPDMESDLKGDGTSLGGVMLVRPDGTVPFHHNEKAFGDFCPDGPEELRPYLLEYPPDSSTVSPKLPEVAQAAAAEEAVEVSA